MLHGWLSILPILARLALCYPGSATPVVRSDGLLGGGRFLVTLLTMVEWSVSWLPRVR
jgi:hypothetical protein